MAVTSINGPAAADLEEPNWTSLIPRKKPNSNGLPAEARRDANRYWLRIVAELREAGTLATANGHQVQRLVLAYLRYDHAARMMLCEGAVVPSPKTKVPQHNLWRDEVRAADADATTAEMELGITPRRRGSVAKVSRNKRQARAADAFLSRSNNPVG